MASSTIIDQELTTRLWERFHKELKGFIISRVKDEEVANDILQEAFIRIHNKIDTLKDENKTRSWIYMITRNLIMDHFRNLKNTVSPDLIPEEAAERPEGDFMSVAINDMIQMMDQLPGEYCQALCLTELEGLSHKEYAEKAGISYAAAKTRAHRARQILRDMLMNCCHYQFDKYGTVLDISPAGCCCC